MVSTHPQLSNLQAKLKTQEKNIENIENLITSMKSIKSFTYNHDFKILPSQRHIPFEPNPKFSGRDEELVKLYLEIIGDINKQNILIFFS